MANRRKTERNKKILDLWNEGKGWRQVSIARMFKMKVSAVGMTIYRENLRAKKDRDSLDG